MQRRDFLGGSAATAVMIAGSPVLADWQPRRPINAVVPYGAGGGTDTIARALVGAVADALPVPIVIVNKPGASGITGATEVSRANADGGTILITSAGSFVLNSIMKDIDIDPFEDFVPIAQVGDLTTSVMVPVNSPFQSMDELIAAAKENPGSLRWAHTGRGSFHHVAGQGFMNAAGITGVDVPFQGGSNTRAAVIGGQVDFGMIGIQQATGFKDELRALALVGAERDAFATDVPTFAELGVDAPLISSPIVVFAPSGTPDEVVAALQAAVQTAAASASFEEQMENRGNKPIFLTGPEAGAKLMKMREDAQVIVDSLS